MIPLPLRTKLTITFAAATIAVLAGAGAFVDVRLASDFNEQVTTGLRARSRAAANLHDDSVASLRASGIGGFEESRETFAQVLTPRGALTARVAHPSAAAKPAGSPSPALRGSGIHPLVL